MKYFDYIIIIIYHNIFAIDIFSWVLIKILRLNLWSFRGRGRMLYHMPTGHNLSWCNFSPDPYFRARRAERTERIQTNRVFSRSLRRFSPHGNRSSRSVVSGSPTTGSQSTTRNAWRRWWLSGCVSGYPRSWHHRKGGVIGRNRRASSTHGVIQAWAAKASSWPCFKLASHVRNKIGSTL